ncbi:hypothetical protein W02_16440 [Nitrospira sp. KM1]|uniref:response regulator n=1 Tax=Nitrospira sp. KM1 TaxID=1936990 RepID=UPI0013A78D0E|nr:response regulator [Nitrospira sp. KM1]BCA54504.1 hypothetical protein W02_16440 [Nitrospira sp. KM1]
MDQDGYDLSVLIVDASHSDRLEYTSRLNTSRSRYRIAEAIDGKSGLETLRKAHFDCVIMDLTLPDMSGFELLLNILPDPQQPKVAVIVLTGLGNRAFHDVAIMNGAQACLIKSETSVEMLDQFIREAVDKVPSSLRSMTWEDAAANDRPSIPT